MVRGAESLMDTGSSLSQEILDVLSNLKEVNDLRRLYCEFLNYEFEDLAVPTWDWTRSARNVVEDGRIIAKRSNFYVLFFSINKLLTTTNERAVINDVLRRYPESVLIFRSSQEPVWHIVSPKFDPESPRKFRIRRYVVGPGERLRTAAERLHLTCAEDDDSATRLKEKHDGAFNVEAVTKEFFEKYKEVLDVVKKDLYKQRRADEQTTHAFVQQLLNRLMFLYFVQKKGWLNKDPHFIRNLLSNYEKRGPLGGGLYQEWVTPMFFHAFNKKPLPQNANLPGDLREIYLNMPFLNGGLFTPNGLDEVGFKVKDTHIRLIINGLLERFNFTIREDTPLEVEVAVDPEMLGKVYESLVLEEERGKSGIFYTPRDEVYFMCRQSLIEHVVEKTGLSYDEVIPFVWGEPYHESVPEEHLPSEAFKRIRDTLCDVKIVDPACGSGSFLVAIMHVLLELHKKIAEALGEDLDEFEAKKRTIQENLFGVDIKRWAVRVAELRLWLALIVDADETKVDLYSEPLLPNLTYKLREGDSLVQELAGRQLSIRAMYGRFPSTVKRSLEELVALKRDYYYGERDGAIAERIEEKEIEILRGIIKDRLREIELKMKPLAVVQHRLGTVQTAIPLLKEEEKREVEKEKLQEEKDRLKKILASIEETREMFFWEIDFPEVFADGGFDIVIGNPPYVRQELIAPANRPPEKQTREVRRAYKEAVARSVQVHWGSEFQKDMKSDFYIYFFYHGLSLLKPGGAFCFVTSNSWLDVGFGLKFQRFLLRNVAVKAVYDNLARRTFAESDINTVISVFKRSLKKDLPGNLVRFVAFKKPYENVLNAENLVEIKNSANVIRKESYRCIPALQKDLWNSGLPKDNAKQSALMQEDFVGNYFGDKWGKYLRAPDIFFTILEKSAGKLVRLQEMGKVRYPIKTGINEFFYVNDEVIQKFGIEPELLVPVVKSPKDFKSIRLTEDCLNTFLFRCNVSKRELLKQDKKGALSYIEWGEKQVTKPRQKTPKGVPWPEVPSVQGRRPSWYSIEEIDPADATCNRFFDKRFFFGFCDTPVIEDQTFYGLIFSPDYKEVKDAQIAILNTTLSYLFVEIFGRVALGQGVLQYATYEMGSLPTVDAKKMQRILRGRMASAFSSVANREIRPIFEEIKMQDRREMDDVIFDFIGLSKDERGEVYAALLQLVQNRLEKAVSLSRYIDANA